MFQGLSTNETPGAITDFIWVECVQIAMVVAALLTKEEDGGDSFAIALSIRPLREKTARRAFLCRSQLGGQMGRTRRWGNTVGLPEIRNFYSRLQSGFGRALCMTSAIFYALKIR